MKAVSVLLCFALAHGITASIFKQQDRPVAGLDVQQQEYINQYQQHRNQPSSNEKQRSLRSEHQTSRKQQRTQYQQQRYLQRDQQSQEQQWQQPQQSIYEHHSLPSQPQQYLQYQQPAYQSVHYQSAQHSQEQDNQYQKPGYERVRYQSAQNSQEQQRYPLQKPTRPQADSSSSESSQNSQESYERRNSYNNEKTPRIQQWASPLFTSAVNQESQMVPVYGDAIVWNGIQMAVGPNAPVQSQEDIEKIFGDAQKVMNHISEEDKIKFHQAYELVNQQNNEDVELNATQLAQKYQYPVEEHTIKTDDGYMLTLFRITPQKQNIRDVQKRPVVFLMHGILGSADDWLLMGPGKSLAYLLADAGYDVWLGNARGNKYSRRHVSKHPALTDFWQYSTDEIALHDLPAMIDYALQTTQQEKLYYIGHAQGTTAFFALTATRPEYNNKIIMMYALSPMVYMSNVRSPLFRMIAPTSPFHERLQHQFGKGAFTPNKELIHTIGGDMLENAIGCKEVSSHVNFVMSGVNVDGLDAKIIPVVMSHLPAGTSTKVIKQYGQAVASQQFQRYDYGPYINQKVYGMEQPPTYEMEKVSAPVTLFYSEEDWLAHPKDVARLAQVLPNVRGTNKVSDEHFSHMDFQFSTKAPEMVYKQLIESMENNQ